LVALHPIQHLYRCYSICSKVKDYHDYLTLHRSISQAFDSCCSSDAIYSVIQDMSALAK